MPILLELELTNEHCYTHSLALPAYENTLTLATQFDGVQTGTQIEAKYKSSTPSNAF